MQFWKERRTGGSRARPDGRTRTDATSGQAVIRVPEERTDV